MKRKALAWILMLMLLLPYGAASAVTDAEQGILIDPYGPQDTPWPEDILLDLNTLILSPDEFLEGGVYGGEPATIDTGEHAEDPPNEGETLISLEVDGVFQEGDLFGEQIVKKPGFGLFALLPDTMEQLRLAILAAVENMAASVNLSAFSIPASESADVTAACAAVINGNPQLFYWNSTKISGAVVGGNITRIDLVYHNDAVAMRQAYEVEAERIIATFISNDMSDTQKALALHDALALHVRYHYDAYEHQKNNTQTPYINPYPNAYNAYGAVVEKHAVCQGYALAYIELLKRAGVDALFVPSSSMNHAWNLVYIKTAGVSGWYHVDVTHDDPLYSASPDGNRDIDGAVMHNNLLLNELEIAQTIHSGHTIPEGVSVSPVSHGQKALWSGVETGMFYAAGTWFTSDIRPRNQSGYNYGRLRGSLTRTEPTGTKLTLLTNIAPPVRDNDRLYYFVYESESSQAGNLHYYDMITGETGIELVLQAGMYVAELYAPGNGCLYARLLDTATSSVVHDRMHVIGSTYGADYTVSIDGMPRVGETLTATPANAPSGIVYRWFRGDDAFGANETLIAGAEGTSYALQTADAGKFIKAEAYVEGAQGKAESLRLGPVMKMGQVLVPSAPTLLVKTDTAVTLQAIAGAEYAYGKSADAPESGWQANPQFTGLERDETYYFFARYSETQDYGASPAGTASEAITTYAHAYRITAAQPPAGSAVRIYISGVEVDSAPVGEGIQIAAIAGQDHYFTGWSSTPALLFADASQPSTTFTMPAGDVTLTAGFSEKAQPLITTTHTVFVYDGAARSTTLSASGYTGYADEQAFLADVTLTYNGEADQPTEVGNYNVMAVYAGNSQNKAAFAVGSLTIISVQHTTPSAPSVTGADITHTSIAHDALTGYKYLLLPSHAAAPTLDTAGWRDGTGGKLTWTGLTPGSEYSLYTYRIEDRNHYASEVSEPQSVSTEHVWALTADPPSAGLFARETEASEVLTITVTNTGTGAIEGLALTKSGANADMLSPGTISPTSLAPGENATFTLSGSAPSYAGVYKATIIVDAQKAGTGGAVDALSIPVVFTVENKELVTFTGLTPQEVVYDGTPQAYDTTGISAVSDDGAYEQTPEHSYHGTSTSGVPYNATTPPTDAGSYTFTIKVSDTDTGYMGSQSTGFTIKPKTLTIEGISVAEKTYDGTLDATVSGGTLQGVEAADAGQVQTSALPNPGVFDTIHRGEDKPVYIDAVTLTGARAFNYTLAQPQLKGAIKPKIVIPIVTIGPRVYNGTDSVTTLTAGFAPGAILAGDHLSISYIGSTYADKNAGLNKPITPGTRMITGNGYGDYDIQNPTSIQGDITPHRVTVAVTGAADHEYDGKEKTLTATYAALGDDTPRVTLRYNGLAQAPVRAGTYNVTVELDDANYELDSSVYTDGISSGPRQLRIARGIITANNVTKNMRFDELTTVMLGKPDFDIKPQTPGAVPPEGGFELLGVEGDSGLISPSPQAGDTLAFRLVGTLTAADSGKSAVIRLRFRPLSDTYEPIELRVSVNIVSESSTSVVTGAPSTVSLGEALDISALKLVTTLDSGAVYIVNGADLSIEGYTPDTPPYSTGMLRSYSVTVTDPLNPHRSASFTVQVTDVAENIRVVPPTKTLYQWWRDTALDLTGGRVELVMRSGAVNDVTMTQDMLNRTSAILKTLGSYAVSLTYKGQTVSNAFTLEVERSEPLTSSPAHGQPGVSAIAAGSVISTDGVQANYSDIRLRIRALLAGDEALLNRAIAASPQFAGIPSSNILRMDICLWDALKGKEATLTSGSITIQLPYPDGTNNLDTFYILHRKANGTTVVYTPSKTANGLSFTVSGFSPFAVGWIKYVPQGGNGGYDDGRYNNDGWYYNGAQGGWNGYVPSSATQLRQQAFWDAVLDAILTAKRGSTIRVNARAYDQMPTDIMHALRDTNSTLIVNWDGGGSIRVTGKTAPKPEAGRSYYPLSLLAEQFPYQASSSSSSGGSSGSSSSSSSSGSSSGSSSSSSSGSSSSSSSESGSSSSTGSGSSNTSGSGNTDDTDDTDAVQAATSDMSEMIDLDAPLVDEDMRDEYTPPTEGIETPPQGEEIIQLEPPAYAQMEEDDDQEDKGGDIAHWLLFACILLLLGAVGVVFRFLIKKKKAA